MKKMILQLFAVGLLFAIGQGLQCYKCNIGFWNLCFTSIITCAENEHCYSGLGEAATFVNIMMKGCLPVGDCNNTVKIAFDAYNSIYSMNKVCCNTDLCNAAPGLPGASGVGLALTTITALLMTQVMM